MKNNVSSLIRWSGSKRKIAHDILKFVPDFNTYYEPFLGGGAMMYLLANKPTIASDIYEPLINFWKMVQNDHQYLIDNYEQQWNLLQNNKPDYYYIVRERFNKEHAPEDLSFLLRTCVNGIVRFNNSGEFNTSFHLTRNGMNPKTFANNVGQWHTKIKNVHFIHDDYSNVVVNAKHGDLVYLDPPYVGDRARYISGLDEQKFYNVLENLNTNSVNWIVSFDGYRGDMVYNHEIPKELYIRKEMIDAGISGLSAVLNGKTEKTVESLYLNF